MSEQNPLTRRQLFKIAGIGSLGAFGMAVAGAPIWLVDEASAAPSGQGTTPVLTEGQILAANAKILVATFPSRCVGCRRCELACTEFNEGKANPVLARIQVGRNLLFGPQGVQLGTWRGQGKFGNHRVIQDTCKQCPHPIPCQLACPQGAIEVSGPANARVVNQDKCVGCRICQQACPWEMTRFDEDIKKATKCHLCGGDPKCVQVCPTGALQVIPWADMTRVTPRRFVVPAYIQTPATTQESCAKCH